MDDILKLAPNGILKISVKANAKNTELIGIDNDVVKVAVSEPADKNKANKEIIRFFSKLLKKRVSIKSGLTRREKLLRIQ